jgi:hypothetical protein
MMQFARSLDIRSEQDQIIVSLLDFVENLLVEVAFSRQRPAKPSVA